MTPDHLARIAAAIEADAATEAAMQAAPWCPVEHIDDDEWCVTQGDALIPWGEDGQPGGDCRVAQMLWPCDAAGIARMRNRWAAYVALARACADAGSLPPRVWAALAALVPAETEE